MRLLDLHPRFIDAGGAGIFKADMTPAPHRRGIGLAFDCPCGKCDPETLWCFVGFANPIDGGPPHDPSRPTWQRTGETFENMTLTPSIFRNPAKGGCGWHGYITNGQITTA